VLVCVRVYVITPGTVPQSGPANARGGDLMGASGRALEFAMGELGATSEVPQ
jgi:hypothetical protein